MKPALKSVSPAEFNAENPYLLGPFAPVDDEVVLPELTVRGELPREIHGMFVRNGPNPRFAPAGKHHWFDGDAMLHAMELTDGRATYRNRYLRTSEFEEESAAGRALYKGILEPFALGDDHPDKFTANTDVTYHAGRLLSLWWQGAPAYEIDLPELTTAGVCDFGRTFAGGMTAHSKVDPRTGEMMYIDFNVYREPYLYYGVIDAAGKMAHREAITIPGPRFFHDIAVTENYTILLDMPLVWHTGRMQKGQRMAYFDHTLPARFGILPRYGTDADVRWFETDPCYILHTINAHESKNERGETEITMTACRLENPIPGRRYDPTRGPLLHFLQVQPYLHRWTFHLADGGVKGEQLDDRSTEFPRMNDDLLGVRTRHSYHPLIAPKSEIYFEGVIKYDVDSGASQEYRYGPHRFGGEVVYIPGPGRTEDDGWISTFVYDLRDDSAEFEIIRAADIAAGPVATIPVPRRVPFGFHACWAPLL